MANKANSGNLTRRKVLQFSAGAVALSLPGLSMPALAQSKPTELLVTVGGGDWGVFIRKAFFDDYTKQTGIKINPQPFKGLAELKAMVEAKAWGQFDLLLMAAGDAAMAEAQGLAEPIDYSVVDKSSFLPGTTFDCWFLNDLGPEVISWNTDAVPEGSEPKNWVDFFNPENKAPRALYKSGNQTLDIAALGGGTPLDKLYPFDIDKALKTLSAVREHIVWYEGGAQSAQMIVDGTVDMAMLWMNRADALVVDKKPVKFIPYNTIMDGDGIVIPKGHPKKAAAMEFAAFMASPEAQARLTNQVAMGPTNTKAFPLVEPDKLAKTASHPDNFPKNRLQDFKWLAENTEKITNEFNKWLIG
ncbi:extracellular solute-binding protein [Mesorhizobium sp. CU2]|uniref:extracellular solute-binding protein n=1 Tax=unclassified Mesorhizobium TaxID=325217 RepID=UPI00112B16EA|nr:MULTISPECIES: extracellular solute-binding protein [unclassified Mesorhizobium]TPN81130.1 extracellular solute-binding protein [Mesorhizobium sp. CU3]TPO17071.1 extracellular solute-binding protein [Mesorhizobium sp. CU2]